MNFAIIHFKFITVIKKEKAESYSHWSVIITSEAVNLDQSECRKINSHLEIYTNGLLLYAKT